MGRPRKPEPTKVCPRCGETFERKRFNGRLEDLTRFLSRTHCSQSCGNGTDAPTKGALRDRAQKHRGDRCEVCGTAENLHAHHVDEDLTNNEPSNIQTLCGSCHLKHHWRGWREGRPAGRAHAG